METQKTIPQTRVYTLTKIALCITLLIVCSYLVVPLPFTPVVITGQTLAVNLIALLLTPKQTFAAIGVYLLAGLIGLPVFAGGISGPAKFVSPTGGFLIGFLAAAVLISLLKGKNNQFWRYLLVTALVGIPVINLFGVIMMSITQGVTLQAAFLSTVAPFLIGDVIKAVLASLLAFLLNKRLPKQFTA